MFDDPHIHAFLSSFGRINSKFLMILLLLLLPPPYISAIDRYCFLYLASSLLLYVLFFLFCCKIFFSIDFTLLLCSDFFLVPRFLIEFFYIYVTMRDMMIDSRYFKIGRRFHRNRRRN